MAISLSRTGEPLCQATTRFSYSAACSIWPVASTVTFCRLPSSAPTGVEELAAATAVLTCVERQAARRRGVGIDGDAHGEFLLAEHQHLRDAGNLRDLLGENLFGVVVDLATAAASSRPAR